MNIAIIRALRQTNAEMTDDQFIAFANETVFEPVPFFVSYRTIRFELGKHDETPTKQGAKQKTEAIMSLIQQGDQLAHQMLLVPGDQYGNGGGLDLSLPESQAMIDVIQSQGIVTQDEADSLRNLSRVGHKRYAEWECSQFGTTELSEALPDPAVALLAASLPEGWSLFSNGGGFDILAIDGRQVHFVALPTLELINSTLAAIYGGGE